MRRAVCIIRAAWCISVVSWLIPCLYKDSRPRTDSWKQLRGSGNKNPAIKYCKTHQIEARSQLWTFLSYKIPIERSRSSHFNKILSLTVYTVSPVKGDLTGSQVKTRAMWRRSDTLVNGAPAQREDIGSFLFPKTRLRVRNWTYINRRRRVGEIAAVWSKNRSFFKSKVKECGGKKNRTLKKNKVCETKTLQLSWTAAPAALMRAAKGVWKWGNRSDQEQEVCFSKFFAVALMFRGWEAFCSNR